MASFIIRAARAGDVERLSAIGSASFVETFGSLYAAEDLTAFLKKSHSDAVYAQILGDNRFAAWIVEDQFGDDAGYAVAGPCTLPVPELREGAGELSRLYLLGRAQGSGYGAQLLGLALDWLKVRYQPIHLSVYAENFRAQRLYRQHGFEKIHEYEYMVGNHADPEWIMELR